MIFIMGFFLSSDCVLIKSALFNPSLLNVIFCDKLNFLKSNYLFQYAFSVCLVVETLCTPKPPVGCLSQAGTDAWQLSIWVVLREFVTMVPKNRRCSCDIYINGTGGYSQNPVPAQFH